MDQGPIAQSGAWLAVGREIAETLARVDASAFQPSSTSSEMRGAAGSSRDRGVRGSSRRWPRCVSCTSAALRILSVKRPPHPFALGMGSASSRDPARPRSAFHFGRIAKEEGARIALITREPDSELAQLADCVFHAPDRNDATVRRQPLRADEPHSPRCDCPGTDAGHPRCASDHAQPPHQPAIERCGVTASAKRPASRNRYRNWAASARRFFIARDRCSLSARGNTIRSCRASAWRSNGQLTGGTGRLKAFAAFSETTESAARRVGAISACGQMHGTVLVDDNGQLVLDSVQLWNDKRPGEEVSAFVAAHDLDALWPTCRQSSVRRLARVQAEMDRPQST